MAVLRSNLSFNRRGGAGAADSVDMYRHCGHRLRSTFRVIAVLQTIPEIGCGLMYIFKCTFIG